MDLFVRLLGLFQPGYLLFIPTFFVAAFTFWRSKKNEIIKHNDIYMLLGRLVVVTPIVGVIFYVVNSEPVFFMVCSVLYLTFRWARKQGYDVWENCDAMIFPLLILLSSWPVASWLQGNLVQTVMRLVLTVVLIWWTWFYSQRYRRLTWYPSGKVGFRSLTFVMIFSLLYGISAIYLRHGLSWWDTCWMITLLLLFNVFLIRSGLIVEEKYWLVKLKKRVRLILKYRYIQRSLDGKS